MNFDLKIPSNEALNWLDEHLKFWDVDMKE